MDGCCKCPHVLPECSLARDSEHFYQSTLSSVYWNWLNCVCVSQRATRRLANVADICSLLDIANCAHFWHSFAPCLSASLPPHQGHPWLALWCAAAAHVRASESARCDFVFCQIRLTVGCRIIDCNPHSQTFPYPKVKPFIRAIHVIICVYNLGECIQSGCCT